VTLEAKRLGWTFIDELRSIVGPHHVLTKTNTTLRYRTGFRFGSGAVLAVVRPRTLVEQWKVLNACVLQTRSSSSRLRIPASGSGEDIPTL
jgi:FAD/FMN-containing dehydrogenase